MTDVSEHDLVARARQSDVPAFTELLREHDNLMRAYAYRLLAGDMALAEDALQDAYLKAFRNIGRFRRESAFATWLHRIVHNCCVDMLRQRRDTSREDPDVPPAADHADGTVDRIDVAAALAALPVDHRAVLVLVDAHGFDYRDAAEVLSVPVGTVRSRLARARAALRMSLEEANG